MAITKSFRPSDDDAALFASLFDGQNLTTSEQFHELVTAMAAQRNGQQTECVNNETAERLQLLEQVVNTIAKEYETDPDPEKLLETCRVYKKRFVDLQAETERLQSVNADLQAETERLQSVNADLQAETERLQSVNADLQAETERLQSVNADLQAETERLQSVNADLQAETERLQSVNTELQSVNTDLSTSVNGLQMRVNGLQTTLSTLSTTLKTDVNTLQTGVINGVITIGLQPFTRKLLDLTVQRLAERYNKEVSAEQILSDMFIRYTVFQYTQWFYPFVITDREIVEIVNEYNPEITTIGQVRKLF